MNPAVNTCSGVTCTVAVKWISRLALGCQDAYKTQERRSRGQTVMAGHGEVELGGHGEVAAVGTGARAIMVEISGASRSIGCTRIRRCCGHMQLS